jgi:glycosyltransferase involved in cell wall biosynthesis
MRVLLIIPAYNEEDNIAETVRQVRAFSSLPPEIQLDYLVVNDGSVDGTAEICEKEDLHTASLVCNLGIGGAVQTGYRYAYRNGYDAAVQFDGDGQHDISSLPDLLAGLAQADLVIGSRFLGEESFRSTAMRRAGIKILSDLIRMTTGQRILDCTSGYRAAGREVIRFFERDYPQDYPEPESIVQLSARGFRILEVPAKMRSRTGGASSIRAWKSVLYMIKVSLAILVASFGRKETRR